MGHLPRETSGQRVTSGDRGQYSVRDLGTSARHINSRDLTRADGFAPVLRRRDKTTIGFPSGLGGRQL